MSKKSELPITSNIKSNTKFKVQHVPWGMPQFVQQQTRRGAQHHVVRRQAGVLHAGKGFPLFLGVRHSFRHTTDRVSFSVGHKGTWQGGEDVRGDVEKSECG